jgi:hypothetical protein
MRAGALLLAALSAPTILVAQADTARVVISGTVVDPSRRPIEGAEVTILGQNQVATTAANGSFRLLGPASGDILLRVRRPGWNAMLLRMTGAWDGTVVLTPGVFTLPDLKVNANLAKPSRYAGTNKYDGFFQRRRQGLGLFITRDEIDRRVPLYTADLLQARAGIKASITPAGVGSMIYFARCNERRLGSRAAITPRITVYIDGAKQYPEFGSPFNGELLERVSTRDIEMIEVFRGPGELPPEFNDGNCGAIVIWTRQGGR